MTEIELLRSKKRLDRIVPIDSKKRPLRVCVFLQVSGSSVFPFPQRSRKLCRNFSKFWCTFTFEWGIFSKILTVVPFQRTQLTPRHSEEVLEGQTRSQDTIRAIVFSLARRASPARLIPSDCPALASERTKPAAAQIRQSRGSIGRKMQSTALPG